MRTRVLHNNNGLRTLIAVLEHGDEAMGCLGAIAREHGISAAQVTAIGAFESAELAFFDWETKDYLPIPVEEQTEVASLIGDIALDAEGRPSLHLHAVLGRRDGQTVSGHFVKGRVRPTLEVVINETPAHLHRVKDAQTGLALIRPERG